ncbi:MAG: GNAT family N-acetyltransferase [Anaerolineales bacterium]|nr:GNAT family N-acetyltransferase [Anaerolineales bacterium]
MNASQLSIRKATVKDAGLLAAFGARTFEEAFGSQNSQEDIEEYLSSNFNVEHIRSQLVNRSSSFLLAYKGDRLVGYSMLRAGNAPDAVSGSKPIELVRIYIDGIHMGKGHGSRLMEACIEAATIAGHDVIWLGVWEKNESAITFYGKWDFKKVGTKDFILGSDIQHDFIMERIVSKAA